MSGQKTGAFSKRTALVIILVGVFTFSAFIVLSAYAPKLREGTDGGTHALSKGATGFAFIAELLKRSGVETLAPRGAIFDATDGVLVYTPREFDALEKNGALDPYQITVIVAPKWSTVNDPPPRGWVRKLNTKQPRDLSFEFEGEKFSVSFSRIPGTTNVTLQAVDSYGGVILEPVGSAAIGEIDRLQYLPQNDALEPMIAANGGQTLIAKLKDAPVYIISDPDLANTHGLTDEARARLAAEFFNYARAGGPVIFDLTLHGIERTRNVVRLMLEPPFLAATLCVLLATLLLALKAAARFGPARSSARAFEAGKSALADNSAALVRMARRETAFGGRYAELTRRRIAEAIGAPKNISHHDLDRLVKKIAKNDQDFETLAERLKSSDNSAYFVKTAKRLYQIKKEIVREPH